MLLIVFLTSVAADIQTMLEETQLKFEEMYSVFHFHTIFPINLLRASETSYNLQRAKQKYSASVRTH